MTISRARIGYLTYGLDRKPTGIGRYAVELLRAMQDIPEAPDIVLLTTEQMDPNGLWSAFEQHALRGCRLLPALLTVGNLVLRQAALRYRLDLIHDPNGIAPFLCLPSHIKRVVTIHDAVAYVHPETHNRLDIIRYHTMLPAMAQRADAVITDSEHGRGDVQRYLNLRQQQVRAVACGVAASFHPIPSSPERQALLARYAISEPYLFYVGGLNPRKNISRLLEAFARVVQTRPNLTLLLGGAAQWQTSGIDATVNRLQLNSSVHFLGYVNDADLPAIYSAAEAFVFPSIYEGFGLPPLESMACGTPVITSHTSSLPEVVADAAVLVDPHDVSAIANAIERVLADPELREELRTNGCTRAAKFTWERTARSTLEIYTQVLQQ